MRKLIYAGVICAAAGCARVMPPSGGSRDQEAPRIVETDPAQNATATEHAGSNRPVRIVFHETLSERSPREMVQVSPETGEVEVDRDGNELKVTIAGGWQAGKVYRVAVLPGIVDRFGNARTAAYELVFSTGAAILPNALGGVATDRITGRPVAGARVEAISRADSTVYTTVSDTSGFFALRALPAATYGLQVYVDQNRNREMDVFESRAVRDLAIGERDTLAVELTLLARDTTPARMVRAEIRDSLQVRLIFDDYMDPSGVLPVMQVTAWQLPDSTMITGGSVMTPRAFAALRVDTARAGARPGQALPDTARVLPINELVWVPAAPLRPSTRYRISMTGYRNVNGLPNGGGSVLTTSPARVRTPPPLRPDTTGARRDTTAVPRDTTRS